MDFSKEIIHFQNEKTFEKILQLSPLEIEIAMEINLKMRLPLCFDFSAIKEKIVFQENSLKQAVFSGDHALKIWEICKDLCFLYLVCADIYLTQRKFDFFSKYYKKAEHIFKPPSHDSEWQNKNEWLACKIILGMLRASHLAKEGNLTETLEILESIKSERFVKSSSILLRKIYWGLGTLYNQYKEKEKSIECFKGGLKISDLEDEFHKSIKLEEEDYFLIYYVYFKYKTSKLLKAIKKSEEALSILKEAAFNIKEISEKSKIKGKIIFAKEFMNIIDFIGLKIKILFSSILAIPPKTKTFKNSEDKKISPSNETFNHYLLSIRQKKNQNGHTPKNQNSTLQKSSLLKKLRRDSTEELEEKGEYLLKDIYKSRPLISKVDQNFLKNLSLSKSREIHKSYLNNSYLPKTSRTNTHRTLYSNYVINQEKQSQTKIYQILERPSLGNIGNVTSRENSKNKSESLRKSKTQRSDFKIKSKNDTESQNQFNNNNKTVNQNNLKKIIDRLRGEKASQDQSYLKEYPVQSSRNMKNTLNIIEEKSSGFLTEKNSNFGPNHYNIEKENKVKTKPFQRNQTLKEMIFKLSSKDQNYINKIKSNIIETKDNNNLEIIYDDNYLLKQEAIKDITEISDNDLKLKKRTDLELFDINEEYQLLTKTDRSLKKIRFSLKTLHAESSYLKKTPRENIDSFLPRSSLRKSTNLGFFRKDSNEDDGKSILSLRSSLLPGNFISYFNQNPDYLDFEISKEERMKRIKAKKLILFQFRKYKKKKNAIAQNETLIITNPTENTANDKLPISNIGYYNQFLSQSAKFKKKSSPYKRTYTNLLVEDLIVPFQRKVTQIKVSEENSLKLIMKTYFSDCKKKNLGSKNIKDNENLFKEQHINKLENISRLSFFIMCFFEGKLKKIQIRIKKFLTDYLTINLNSNNFSFDLQLALDPETRDKALVENKTVWPIAFEALLNYMKSEKMVNENDLFEEIESFKKVTFASDYLKANNITIVDLENLGYLKMLIEVFLQKNFTMQRKCFGQTLIYQKADSSTPKGLLIRQVCKMLTQQKKFQKIRNIKDTIQASSNFEEMRLQQLKIEIGDIESNYSEEIKLERTQYLNRNSTISLFLLKDNFWKKFWLLKVSWFWEKETIGPLIKISAYDCKNSKNESSYKLLDWDRFLKRIGNQFLNFSELEEEFFIYFGLHRRTKKMLLESFKKSFQINNNRILVLSDEEKNKSHKNERDFFKKKEIFGFDLWNLKIPKITVAKNENLFKKGFDDIYKHFFENKREYLEDEKEKEVKIVNMEENDDFSQEKHLKNTILIEENVEKQDRKKSLRCFRIEKQNTFYNYFKNFIKDHNLLQLYCRLPRKFSLLNLKLSFCFYDENNSVEVNLKFYDPFRRNNFYYNMYDLKDIILITNILLVDNPKIRKKNLSQIVNDVLQYNGIRLNCRNSQNNTQKKPILNENTLKSFIMNSFLEKNTRFNQTSVVFLQKLPNLGKVIVFIDIFESKQATSENRVLFSIKILDFFSKIRRFKIILSLDDISFYFPQHTLTEKTSLHEIKLHFMKILTYFSLEKLSIYSCLVFFPSNYHDILHNNLRKAASSNRFERTRKYKNCFNEKRGIPIFPKKNNCLLDEFVQDSRNIVKIIKKHQGNFYFITVSKNLLMNYWIIKIYLPKSSRNFMGYLNNSELLKFSVEDLSKAFDRNLKDFIEKPRDCESFMGFLNQIMQTPQMLTFSQAFDKAYPSKRNSNGNNLLYKFNQKFKLQKAALVNKFTSKRMKKMQKIKALMNLTKKIDNFKGNFFEKNLFEFSEIEFWMRLLNKLEISSDKSNKFEIKQGEFRLRLKEFFFNKYVKVDNYNEAIIEIFFFFLNENPSVFTTLDSIHYAYLMNYNFVIKYLSLNRMNIQINSINLRELVNIYISDGFFKHPTNYMHSKLLISDVKDLCNFLIYKIKSANFCNFLHNSNETVIKRRKMHANDNISYMKNIEKEAKLGNEETHLITFVIRAKKYLVVRVFMQIITCKIFIKVYKNQTNELFIKEFRFAELRNCDGFFKELIKKGEWKIIVERLWAITKKELLIEAEFNFKFNES